MTLNECSKTRVRHTTRAKDIVRNSRHLHLGENYLLGFTIYLQLKALGCQIRTSRSSASLFQHRLSFFPPVSPSCQRAHTRPLRHSLASAHPTSSRLPPSPPGTPSPCFLPGERPLVAVARSGCRNEMPQTEELTTNGILFVTVLEAGRSKPKMPGDVVCWLPRVPFLGPRWHLLTGPSRGGRDEGGLWGLVCTGTNPTP